MPVLLALGIAFKLLMLVDAYQRRAHCMWFAVIFVIPGGSVAYFAINVAPDLLHRWGWIGGARRIKTDELRYRHRENPCLENQVALADRLFDERQYQEAEDLFKQALARDPDFARSQYGLGRCLDERGRHAEALEPLSRSVALDRGFDDYGAWLRLAQVRERCGDLDGSIEEFERLLRANARLEHTIELARALVRAGRSEEARTRLDAALVDYKHSPRFVKRTSKACAKDASRLLGQLA